MPHGGKPYLERSLQQYHLFTRSSSTAAGFLQQHHQRDVRHVTYGTWKQTWLVWRFFVSSRKVLTEHLFKYTGSTPPNIFLGIFWAPEHTSFLIFLLVFFWSDLRVKSRMSKSSGVRWGHGANCTHEVHTVLRKTDEAKQSGLLCTSYSCNNKQRTGYWCTKPKEA